MVLLKKTSLILFSFFSLSMLFSNTAFVHDFGELNGPEGVIAEFTITNPADVAVTMTELEISCDCVQVLSYPGALAAGQTAVVTVRLMPYGTDSINQYFILKTDMEGLIFTFELRGTLSKPVTFAPKKIEGVTIPSLIFAKRYFTLNPENSITVAQLSTVEKAKSTKVFFIDVREPDTCSLAGVTNPMAIPVHQIKTKSFLRSGKVVIIGYGFDTFMIEHEVEKLKKYNYDAYMLTGGAAALGQARAKEVAPSPCYTISADDFFTTGSFDGRLVINIDNTHMVNDDVQYWIPSAQSIAGTNYNQEIRKTISLSKAQEALEIVIFNKDGKEYPVLDKTGITGTIFFLEGGLDAYKAFLKNRALLLDESDSKIFKQTKCRSCS